MKDPYRVVMKQRKLPMSLFYDRIKPHVSIIHLYRLEAGLCAQGCHECYLPVGHRAVSVQPGEMLCSRSTGRGNRSRPLGEGCFWEPITVDVECEGKETVHYFPVVREKIYYLLEVLISR